MLEDGSEGDDVHDVVDDHDEDYDGEGSRDQLQRRLLGGADWRQEDKVGRVSLRYAFKKKKRHYLGNFPNMGGGSSQIPKLL